MSDTKSIVLKEINKRITSDESIEQGLWKTGDNKYIDITKLNDEEYLAKIFHTLEQREEKTTQNHIDYMRKNCALMLHVMERAKVIGARIAINKVPLTFTFGDPRLEMLKEQMMDHITTETNS